MGSHSKIVLILMILLGTCVFLYVTQKNCPQIKSKKQWNGRSSSHVDYRTIPIKYVIIHHTVTNECNSFLICSSLIRNIQDYHIDSLNFNDIGYNFLIGNDGAIYEGTGWLVIGAHTYGYNTNGTGIAFIGNYINKLPSDPALKAAKELLECGVKEGYLDENYKLYGGKQLSATESPGLILYKEIQKWDHWSLSP